MAERARWDSAYHAPVLAAEIVRLLREAPATVRRAGTSLPLALDGTLGGGGHSLALLEAGFRVVGTDRDPQALAEASARLQAYLNDGRFRALLANYADVAELDAFSSERLDAVLLDLGISSHQIDDLSRGFSFREGVALDMRMGTDARTDAATFLNDADERELVRVFREYADEPRAPRLAREITRRRATRAFATSDDLVGAIRGALGPRTGPGDFARLFQAVRIEVNDELSRLAQALPALRDRLAPGGRMAIIAYHSGEDRLVKHAFREWSTGCICPPRQPICTCGHVALGETVTRRAVEAGDAEREHNPRARSAKLRVWQRAEVPAEVAS
ncbi:Ribosomal RNA small subunit methyltransferase H [Gemmatirosa kalamazoonensis]|uniref:Ribosomal RNA small subunit methyltransferase H n=1 Tax=Gemmatirosa kalamazoonensis TaxID=861299 RepID=W0RJT5_9BACT|nr:16S rRNA (cytosine(1402)-N(4))-methyltransferase RsmH [Gemmatirosa kalamazoonensis]AHG90605.1 Ribosomal RNA small subunit methyltransferase H [Gemmatirosa kalamazoonensis]